MRKPVTHGSPAFFLVRFFESVARCPICRCALESFAREPTLVEMHAHATWGLRALVGGLLGFGLAAAAPRLTGVWAFLLSPPGIVIGTLMLHTLIAAAVDVLAERLALRIALGVSGLICSVATFAAVVWAWTLGAPTHGLGVFAVVCVVLAIGPFVVVTHRDWVYTRARLTDLARTRDRPTTF